MAESGKGVSPGFERQLEIYEKGLLGIEPALPIRFEDLEEQAKKKLKSKAFDYVAGAAGSEETMHANREAFRRWRIVPRLLRNVAQRDLSIELFGKRYPSPMLLAPVGVVSIIHSDGELAVARAAKSLGIPLILSTVSSTTMEEVAKASAEGPRWFQLYWPAHQELAASFIQRAESAGHSALVVTLDTHLLSWRERDLQNAYLPFWKGDGLANYFSDPVFQATLGGDPRLSPVQAIQLFGKIFSNPALTWENLSWLREQTHLPILLKGILHPDDARRAVEAGMDGIIVSNHGGRQIDGEIASLDALPGIVKTVGDQTTILMDSGIRRGADVFKALALGAKGVLIGRHYCYGLALQGEEGVREVMRNLIADFDLTMGLAGCVSVREIGRGMIVHQTEGQTSI